MASITSVNSKIYTYDQKDREVVQANTVQAVEDAPEVSIQSMVDELAAEKARFQALNNNGRDQHLIDAVSELFIKAQTVIDSVQAINASIPKSQFDIDQRKNIVKQLITTRSETNILLVDDYSDFPLQPSIKTSQKDVILNQELIIDTFLHRQKMIAEIDAQIEGQEEQITQAQSINSKLLQARAESLATSHSALQAIKKNLDQLTQG